MAQSKQKRKLRLTKSMEAAVESVKGGKGLREAQWLYNVPVERLRRVTGWVEMDCRPGPATVLTKSEEDKNRRLFNPDGRYGIWPDT